jgi:Trypsin-co-occurring domain 1
MTQLVQLAEGVMVEVEGDVSIVSVGRQAGLAGVSGAQLATLQSMTDAIGSVCKAVQQSLGTLPKVGRPAEVSVEFGVKIGGEGGLPFITKVTGEANFTVSAKWLDK